MSAPVTCSRGSEIVVLDGRFQYGCWISGTALYTGPESSLLRLDQERPSGRPACFCLSHPTREELELACGRKDANDSLVLCRGVCDTCTPMHACHKSAHTQSCLIFMPGEGERALILWLSKLKLREIG